MSYVRPTQAYFRVSQILVQKATYAQKKKIKKGITTKKKKERKREVRII